MARWLPKASWIHRRFVGLGVISSFDSSSLWSWLSRGRNIIRCCEGRHRGFAHRRVAVRVACPLALRTGALCALELRAEWQPEGYLNRYQLPHGWRIEFMAARTREDELRELPQWRANKAAWEPGVRT